MSTRLLRIDFTSNKATLFDFNILYSSFSRQRVAIAKNSVVVIHPANNNAVDNGINKSVMHKNVIYLEIKRIRRQDRLIA